jgi:hypothetical protein
VDVGVTGIHAALLHTGKVLLFQYPDPELGPNSLAALFDPVTNTTTRVDPPFPRDIFCSGLSIMADGRLLVAGGMDDSNTDTDSAGINAAEIFDPTSETWLDAVPMSFARYYPSLVEMPDGTMLALSGDDETGQTVQLAVEAYDPRSGNWAILPSSANLPSNEDVYPRVMVLPTGQLYQAGPTQGTYLYDPSSMAWSFVGSMHQPRDGGAAVLLPGLRKILTAGGAPVTRTTETFDFSRPKGTWKLTAPMAYGRVELNLVLLADGTVLAVGWSFSLGVVRQPDKGDRTLQSGDGQVDVDGTAAGPAHLPFHRAPPSRQPCTLCRLGLGSTHKHRGDLRSALPVQGQSARHRFCARLGELWPGFRNPYT